MENKIENIWNNKKREWERIRCDDLKSVKLLLFNNPEYFNITVDEFEVCEKYWELVVVENTKKMITKQIIGKVLNNFYKGVLNIMSEKIDELCCENDKKRCKGISFSDRKEIIDRISIIEKLTEKYRNLRITIFSIEDIITPSDIRYIKKNGVENFIRFNHYLLCQKN